jgi:hypothetical protein
MRYIQVICGLTLIIGIVLALVIKEVFPIDYFLVYNSLALLVVCLACSFMLRNQKGNNEKITLKYFLFNKNLLTINGALIFVSYFLFFKGLVLYMFILFVLSYLINLTFIYWIFVVLFNSVIKFRNFTKIISNSFLSLLLFSNIINVSIIENLPEEISVLAFISPMHGLFYIPLFNVPSVYYCSYFFLLFSVVLILFKKRISW